MSRKVVITGVPGVGKSTVIDGALERLKELGREYWPISFGTAMFELASERGLVSDRDEMRRLDQDVQKELQSGAARAIAQISDDVIVDTHCTVKTPGGFLPGLPIWVLEELKPDVFVLVETDPDQILGRRILDESRIRDLEGYGEIRTHQEFNRFIAASYAMVSGCTVKIINNPDFLLEKALADLVEVLR
jgi:adenylate kinase